MASEAGSGTAADGWVIRPTEAIGEPAENPDALVF